MLSRIVGHVAPTHRREASVHGPLQPASSLAALPASAATSVVSALAGAAVAWAWQQRRQQQAPAQPAVTPPRQQRGDPNEVATVGQLREMLPVRDSNGSGIEDAPKVMGQLDEQMTHFIEQSPFLQMGTVDSAGMPYVSPKGDHNGFVMILSLGTLIIPDRPGNSILMGLQNILANPWVGLCFEIPGNTTTLRVVGAQRCPPPIIRRGEFDF
jgi:hypothetical protein